MLVACGLAAAASNGALQAAPFTRQGMLTHLVVGVGVAALAGGAALRWERDTLAALRTALRSEGKRD